MITALIFGVTGQDGSYLAEILLKNGYRVIGVSRRVSVPNTLRLKNVLGDKNFVLVDGDVTDPFSVYRLMVDHDPQEVYNLAAQSHVRTSFDEPTHTWACTATGTLNCLEGIRHLPHPLGVRFYQASSSEMFGSNHSSRWRANKEWQSFVGAGVFYSERPMSNHMWDEEKYQDEATSFAPNSPYAVAKLAAHSLCRVYRDSYGLHVSSGILFNHESPRRGETFVTRKITRYVARLIRSRWFDVPIEKLKLGNLEASRDWGHAEDYVRAMWLMLQQEKPDDYVIATGKTHSVREFLVEAFAVVGLGHDAYTETDSALFRPCEVNYLMGDASKAKKVLDWSPSVNFKQLVRGMVLSDLTDIFGETAALSFCVPEREIS